MPQTPASITATMKADKNFMAEVHRLSGFDCRLLHVWFGEDVVFAVTLWQNTINCLSLTQESENKYRGYIDNISNL